MSVKSSIRKSKGYQSIEKYSKIDFLETALKAVEMAVRKNENVILDYNRSQLFFGIRTDEKKGKGERIKPEYKPRTRRIKIRKSQPSDRVTLKDKGDFYRRFHIVYSGNGFQIISHDVKTPKLIKKYNIRIFGIIDLNRKAFRPYILDAFRKILKNV